MRLFLLICMLSIGIDSLGQHNGIVSKDAFIKKVLTICDSIRSFENKFETTHSIDYQDSVNSYNDLLTLLLSQSQLGDLSSEDLKKITDSTQITILKSSDHKLEIVSWCVFYDLPTALCSNIAFFEKGSSKILSSNGTTNGDRGLNIQFETIIKLIQNKNSGYLLTGSNKCGNLCLDNVATFYTVKNGEVFQKHKSFFDGKNYFDQVEFNYIQNEKINPDPKFQIKKNQITCPIFSKDGTKLAGKRIFKIIL